MVDSIHENGINITYNSAISDSCTDDNVVEELHKLMEFQTKMFIVHMSKVLVSKLLINAEGLGMMSEGYAWFLTATTMNLFTSVDPSVIASMQGLVALKSYIPESKHLHNLTLRLTRKFSIEESNIKVREPSAFGIWAHDSTWALAEAFERIKDYNELSLRMKNGSLLMEEILRSRFTGLSGDFQLVNGKLVSNSFEIVNVRSNGEIRRVAFWSCTEGATRRRHLSSVDDLEEPVIWPGGSITIPKGGSLISMSEMKLKVGVPSNNGFRELVSWIKDPQSNRIAPSGFCVDVFMDTIQTLPYPVQVEFVAFEGRYDDLIYGLYLGGFRKGSPLIQNMSKAIYELRDTGKLVELERKWFVYSLLSLTASDDSANDPHALSLDSYHGLFLISGVSSTLALFLFFGFSIEEKMGNLKDYKFVQLLLQLQSVRRYLSEKTSDGNNDISV
ncbi:hypothetical protein FEM48_Zijuj07G0058600 [Ziziphus jujuba var. spinosa]|uniref:Receptor ligand binding region domain-containing protein n=1 Tax=Ziziphus jujuba var. spinosa TaxID=714518 RepID=A0A978V2U7_ZIZJJ|nr:hypothetical protein FEM48_Zijuj07G0058600 [Ziziphus jujuba var. spinosa]